MEGFLNRQYFAGICIALAVVSLCVYIQVADFDFVGFDDPVFTTENEIVKRGATWAGAKAVFQNPDYFGVQLSMISHMLDVEFFGLAPGKHHLINLLFHVCNTVLLFILLHKFTGDTWPSALAAALFAAHPLNVESVAWIAERRNVLCVFFWFVTILAYFRYVKIGGILSYLVMVILFTMGLMAKQMLVTLPFLLLLLDFWPLNRFSQETRSGLHEAEAEQHNHEVQRSNPYIRISNPIITAFLEKIPLMVISAIASYLTLIAVKNTGGAPGIGGLVSVETLPLEFRIANAMVSYAAYLLKIFWPFNLSLNYPLAKSLPFWKTTLAATLLILITLCATLNHVKKPWLLTGWFWFLGTLIPVIGIIQIGHQAMADRYVYGPIVGIFIIVSWTLADSAKRTPLKKSFIRAAAFLLIFLLATTAWLQTRLWKDTITLFRHVIHITPDYSLAHYNLGLALKQQGRQAEAWRHFAKAVDIYPEFAEANFNLGLLLAQSGRIDPAIQKYQKALARKPDLVEARFNLANLLTRKGQLSQAEKMYSQILKTVPKDTETLDALGRLYALQGNIDLAILYYKKALAINPQLAKTHNNIGVALFRKGDLKRAGEHYIEAIAINPTYLEARNNLATLLLRSGRFEEAKNQLEQILKASPNNRQALYNLAMVHKAGGNLDETILYLTRLVRIDPRFADAGRRLEKLMEKE